MNLLVLKIDYIGEADFTRTHREVRNVEGLEQLLQQNLPSLERFVKFKIQNKYDAEDIIQEVCLAATLKFDTLQNISAFKPWLLGIARHKCSDYYREKAQQLEIPLEALSGAELAVVRFGPRPQNTVRDTLDALGGREKQILYLYYFKNMPQEDIARQLSVPVGTVKSRLHYAKKKFKAHYPIGGTAKGENMTKKLPEIIPEYKIEPSALPPFSVRWEELQGWLIVPRVGEKLKWGMYDFPERKRTEYTEMEVIGRAEVHGIEGVEVVAMQFDPADYYRTGALDRVERRFVAQLSDTHTRYLAETHVENGIRKCYTFLDGEAFLNNWGFGEDNCGNEVNLHTKGLLHREGNCITGTIPREVVDVVGRYNVTIGGKTYDTVCVMDIECFNDAVASEQFVDKNGRTVLWRRFNRDDWAIDRFGGKPWSEKFPENERITINGQTYVHWYDCISDYIL